MTRIFSFPILIAFLAANSLTINELAAFFSSDSMPKPYVGLRLSLFNVRLEGDSKNGATIKTNIVNTGREPLGFSSKIAAPEDLIIEFDTLALPPRLRGKEAFIGHAVLKEKIDLKPGKFRTDVVLKVVFEQPKKTKKAPQPPPDVKKEEQKKVEDSAEKVVGEDTNNGKNNGKKVAEKEPKKAEKPTEIVVGEDAKKGNDQPKKIEKVEKPSKKDSKKTKKAEKAAQPETPKKAIDEPKKAPEKEPIKNPRVALPDLVLDTAWVVKRGKKTVTVAVVIKNQGEATARLGGLSPKKFEDNVAVNAYFSSTKKLTRGAMLADGIFIDERAGNGLLLPFERFSIEIEVPIESQTKFTSFLILELDPFQTLEESDKTNNTRAILTEKTQ